MSGEALLLSLYWDKQDDNNGEEGEEMKRDQKGKRGMIKKET